MVLARHTSNDLHANTSAPRRRIAPIRIGVVRVLLTVNLLHDRIIEPGKQVFKQIRGQKSTLASWQKKKANGERPLTSMLQLALPYRRNRFSGVAASVLSLSSAATDYPRKWGFFAGVNSLVNILPPVWWQNTTA